MALAVLAATVDGIDQLVIQTKVVVAGSIGDALRRHICPAEIRLTEEAGLEDAKICASNSLDEHIIQDMITHGAKIDSFGVGERLITSDSSPILGAPLMATYCNIGQSPKA